MTDNRRWCSKEKEPKFIDCSQCPFDVDLNTCTHRHVFRVDAESQHEIKTSQQMKDEAMAKVVAGNAKCYGVSDNMDVSTIFSGVAVCAILGFPAAYVGQIFQLLSMFLCDTFRVFTASNPMPEIWSESFRDSFFHAEFWNRYWYWTLLMAALFSWSNYNPSSKANETETTFRIVVSVAFVIVALMNFNLFISSIVGPIFLVFGLFVTAKRR